MTVPTMKEMCPSWDGTYCSGKCPELSNSGDDSKLAWSAILDSSNNEYAFAVNLSHGEVMLTSATRFDGTAFCH